MLIKLNNGATEGGEGTLIEFRELKNVQTILSCNLNFLTFGQTKIHELNNLGTVFILINM